MLLLNLLCLVVLASMANSTKKPILSGLIFAVLKGVAVTFLQMANTEEIAVDSSPYLIGGIQFIVNAILGVAIGFLVVRQSKERKATVVSAMLLLSLLTFLADQEVVAFLF